MLGLLKGVIDRVQPVMPEFKMEWASNSVVVSFMHPRYTLGLVPKHIDDVEGQLARITIKFEEGNDRIALLVQNGSTHAIPITVPGSGRVEKDGYVYQYRFDEAVEELARYLKELAGK